MAAWWFLFTNYWWFSIDGCCKWVCCSCCFVWGVPLGWLMVSPLCYVSCIYIFVYWGLWFSGMACRVMLFALFVCFIYCSFNTSVCLFAFGLCMSTTVSGNCWINLGESLVERATWLGLTLMYSAALVTSFTYVNYYYHCYYYYYVLFLFGLRNSVSGLRNSVTCCNL